MKQAMFTVLILMAVFLSGCALLDKIAPSQLDAQGQPIPGSRQPTEVTKAVAGAVPYGDVALYGVLFLAAGYEKFKAYKMEKGLKATLLAGKQVANDPEMKEAWDKVKKYYELEHDNAGVTTLIKSLLAKLPAVKV